MFCQYQTFLIQISKWIHQKNNIIRRQNCDIVDNLEPQIREVPQLTTAERQQLLVEWNQTQIKYPQDACIHQLFEAQVERTPEAVAIVFENQQLTYRELNCRANQLAHHLQSLGVKPDFLVGLCVERSIEMVVGMLGILKAGGAYVPLDPAYPQERLKFMLSSQVSVLLTQKRLIAKLPEEQAQVVCLDTDKGGDVAFKSRKCSHSCDSRQLNLCHLYLRFYRTAQRCNDSPP